MTVGRCGAILAMVSLLLLAGCESAKDRAARHLQTAVALVQQGDMARATVEFRNVFKLDPGNRPGHLAFARALQDQGRLPEAYAQYRILLDADPKDLETLQAAAGIAAQMDDWADAGRHADAALAVNPADPAMQAVRAAADYAAALTAADTPARKAAAARAQALIATRPQDLILRRVVIDSLVQDGDLTGALRAIDDALAVFPPTEILYRLRLSVLAAQKDDAGVEAGLLKMVQLFPQNPSIGQTLLRWYIGKGQLDAAEAFLRDRVARDGLPAQMALVGFLQQYRSADAALAEIDHILTTLPASGTAPDAAAPDATAGAAAITPDMVRALRAGIVFDQGHQADGIKALQDILAAATPSDQSRQIRLSLAQMYGATGDQVQARAEVEKVLAEDAGQAEALKLKATWLIDADKADDAVGLLRQVVAADPHDAAAMTLIARAYDRLGSHDLAGDMLAQAVEASGSAPTETLRYAAFLMADQKYPPAETLLLAALRLDNGNVALLSQLGQLYLRMKDWTRAAAVADELEAASTPEAKKAGRDLRPAILAGQQSVAAAIDYLQGLAGTAGTGAGTGTGNGAAAPDKGNDLGAKVTLLRAYLANGQGPQARALAQDMLTRSPDDPGIRLIAAAVQAATGDPAGAEAAYRAMLAQDPRRAEVWTVLIRQLMQQGRTADAETATDTALTNLPDLPDLLLIKAVFLEQHHDVEGAIAIYEKLYAAHSDNLVVANDLASLLASWRNDADSLDRAWAIARRLNGTNVPALADTYGWILARRGGADAAVPYLENAAKGLADNPEVQFHLAEAYRALNRADDARAQYAKVLALVPADDARPFVKIARQVMAGQVPDGPALIPGLN